MMKMNKNEWENASRCNLLQNNRTTRHNKLSSIDTKSLSFVSYAHSVYRPISTQLSRFLLMCERKHNMLRWIPMYLLSKKYQVER